MKAGVFENFKKYLKKRVRNLLHFCEGDGVGAYYERKKLRTIMIWINLGTLNINKQLVFTKNDHKWSKL